MGDGANLKRILKENNTNVRKVAIATGICPTTLYSIIQKDSRIRLDTAILLADELGIEVEEICFNDGNPIPNELRREEFSQEAKVKLILRTVTDKIAPMMERFGYDNLRKVDNLLWMFYQLDDISRKEILMYLHILLENHSDPVRKREMEQFKKHGYGSKKNNKRGWIDGIS